jgi:lipoprotein-anchoring transpeptidase ErfK/SrfK
MGGGTGRRRRHAGQGRSLGPAALLTVLTVVALAGCTGAASPTDGRGGAGGPGSDAAPTSADPTTSAVPTTIVARIDDGRPLAALALRDLAVLSAPGGTVVAIFPARQPWGDPTVLLVKAYRAGASGNGWYEVLLPRRPNGSTGWVRADQVRVERRPRVVEVDLSARRLTLRDGNRVLWQARVAIGAKATPTPTGSFYVTAKLRYPQISRAFGAWALALSAYSNVLEQFGTGDGQIALHGTADTAQLGRALSSGCIRLDNRTVTKLATVLPLGTPVTIKA